MGKPRIKVAIVNLYGCDLNSPLSTYLDKVAVTVWEEDVKHIILCGGPSQQKKFPGKTEAEVAHEYMRKVLPLDCHFYREIESLTTYDNVQHASTILYNLIETKFNVYQIIYYCEALRALKTAMLARHFFPDFHPGKSERNIRFETDSWEQMNPTKELLATIKDLFAMHIPGIANFFHNQRVKRAKTI